MPRPRKPAAAKAPAARSSPAPMIGARNYQSIEKLRAWVQQHARPGVAFYVATTPRAFTMTGFWKGDEPVADLDTLRQLHRERVLRVEKLFWRGARCFLPAPSEGTI